MKIILNAQISELCFIYLNTEIQMWRSKLFRAFCPFSSGTTKGFIDSLLYVAFCITLICIRNIPEKSYWIHRMSHELQIVHEQVQYSNYIYTLQWETHIYVELVHIFHVLRDSPLIIHISFFTTTYHWNEYYLPWSRRVRYNESKVSLSNISLPSIIMILILLAFLLPLHIVCVDHFNLLAMMTLRSVISFTFWILTCITKYPAMWKKFSLWCHQCLK